MAAGKARTNGGKKQCSDGRPSNPLVDELCMLVGKIVSGDHEVVSKVGMCAELQRMLKRPVPAHSGHDLRSYPHTMSTPQLGRYKMRSFKVRENLQYLELYWNRTAEVNQGAVTYGKFYSHVTKPHNGHNLVAHGTIVFRENTIKNVREKRVFFKNDLLGQLEQTQCALEDVNTICRYLGLVDYDEYMELAQAH